MAHDLPDDEETIFHDLGHKLRDQLERVLVDGYGDVWFDRSGDASRMKVAITTRCHPSAATAAERLIRDSPIADRVDIVPVVWSAVELREAHERLSAALPRPTPVTMTAPDARLNGLVIWVTRELNVHDLGGLKLAIQAAAVPVQVLVKDERWEAQ